MGPGDFVSVQGTGVPLADDSWRGSTDKIHEEVTCKMGPPDLTSRGAARRIPMYYSPPQDGTAEDPGTLASFLRSEGSTEDHLLHPSLSLETRHDIKR